MNEHISSLEISSLFANNNPDEVWAKVEEIVRRISPVYDFSLARTAFDDVIRLFRGEYPGYCAIKTLYHDLPHTLDVLLCATRLMHGVHVSGNPLDDNEITLVLVAMLMHDIGYAQLQGEETGTGAQYTQGHVRRGIVFMQRYCAERGFSPDIAAQLEPVILVTDPVLDFSEIDFPGERIRLLAQIVGTADLVGQMADRCYLEKLLFLYMEFKEAHFGNYQNIYDMFRQTRSFLENMRKKKLDVAFDGIYARLASHFKDCFGVENNFYMESIDKNVAYLSEIILLDEEGTLSMLKRGGIVEKTRDLIDAAKHA